MATSLDNYPIDNDIKTYLIDNESVNCTFTSFSTVKLFEYVMNTSSKEPSTPIRPSNLQRCPSNVSDISGISSFSLATKTANKSLYSDYHVGDYVYVDSISGVKYGVIRYAGYVDFAKGYWFGIELSEPTGKNNGSIRGKSYFTCPENHGIFTQSSKISKSPPIKKIKVNSSGSVFGSRESINSSFLKRNGLNTSQESLRSCVSGVSVSAITGVFKQQPSNKNLKNNLLRSSIDSPARTSGDRVDNLTKEMSYLSVHESEQLVKSKIELSNQKRELEEQCKQFMNEVTGLKLAISEEKRIKEELVNQLEQEKKKIEMIEFRFEEEKIARMNLEEEINKKEKVVNELKRFKEDAINLKNDEKEIEMFELQEESIKKEEKILQLESSLKSKSNENQKFLERIHEFEQLIKVFEQRQENYLGKIDDLNLKIKKYELEKAQLEDALSANKQETSSNFDSVTSELECKKKELDESKDQIIKKTNEISMLKDELERMNQKFAKLEGEKSNLEKELEATKTSLNKQIELLEDSKRTLKTIDERMNKSELEQTEERKQLIQQIECNKKQLNELNSKLEECKLAEQKSLMNLKIKEENFNRIENELKVNQSELANLKSTLASLTASQDKKDAELQKLKQESNRLLEKIEQNQQVKLELETELDNLKSKLEEKESDLNQFNKKKLQFQNEMEQMIRDLNSEKDKNRELLMEKGQLNETQRNSLQSAYKELELIKNAHDQVNIQLEEQIQLVTNLQSKYTQVETKARNLEKANQELKTMISKGEQSKVEDLSSLRNEHSKEMNEIEQKLNDYEENLKKLHDGLVNKDIELNSLELEHQQTVEQLKLASSLKCSDFEKQIIELKCQLDKERKELNELKEAKQNQETELNNDDKDLYESQIKFLNNVIVDMHAQNDKLKSKVKMLEEIRIEEMNMFKLNASADHNETNNNLKDDQFSFKPVIAKNQTTYSFTSTQRTTRLFCDFCDQFDTHDSEDCPVNEKEKQEEQKHTRLGQSKKQQRAYCVHCELFTHWTYDCPNESKE